MPPTQIQRSRTRALLVCAGTFVLAVSAHAATLRDDTAGSGLDFGYANGRSGAFYFPEIMGAGVGVLDYDGDGRLDIYLVQGGPMGPEADPSSRPTDRLFRNVTPAGRGQALRFEDVTVPSGIRAGGYGMGVAVGDIDNDGDDDLYVLNFGANQLWRNEGEGRFRDITAEAGVGDPRWSVSASFADIDGDGLLDLYVANYVDFDFAGHKRCRAAGGGETDYCSPSAYQGVADRLYRNLGGGRFEDISEASGIAAQPGPGLGVIALDVNRDGRLDFYVANDGKPNFLWMNQGGGRFVDDAVLAGVAVNADGAAEAGMGIDAADYDRSGDDDLFVTHMRNESNTLYAALGDGWFEDRTARSGLAASSMAYTGFGAGWFDVDLDGWLDLFIANGAVVREPEPPQGEQDYPYLQRDQLFRHNGRSGVEARLLDVSESAGPALAARGITRGAALADFDEDGRVDVVVSNIEGPARLLRNVTDTTHHWIGFDLRRRDGTRAVHAEVRLVGVDASPRVRRSRGDGSYASAQDPRVVFGLGAHEGPVAIEIRWPDGSREKVTALANDRYHRLRQGDGEPL